MHCGCAPVNPSAAEIPLRAEFQMGRTSMPGVSLTTARCHRVLSDSSSCTTPHPCTPSQSTLTTRTSTISANPVPTLPCPRPPALSSHLPFLPAPYPLPRPAPPNRRAVLLNLRYNECLMTFHNASGAGTNAELFLTGSDAQAARLAAGGACTNISFRTGEQPVAADRAGQGLGTALGCSLPGSLPVLAAWPAYHCAAPVLDPLPPPAAPPPPLLLQARALH
jgi:hypothetical protein